MNVIWDVAERKYEDVIDQLLYNRGIIGEDVDSHAKDMFLNPDFDKDLADPFLLPDLEKAINRVKEAVKNKERIGIFADYDADGTPGAALLFRALTRIGVKSSIFIPSRVEDGYGLNSKGIDYLVSEGCSLIITIDLGIRSVDEAVYCREKGVGLIITDHHLPGETVPEALCVVNPKIGPENNQLYNLCGCGVIYKLIQGLGRYFKEIDTAFLKWHLDLVAISTIADIVPLTGENRLLAKYGLVVLRKTRNTGLRQLIKAAGIDPLKIDTYTVGFQIGPRINTPGRIDHATKSFELLVTEDEGEALEIAKSLNEMNVIRQEEMDRVLNEAVDQIETNSLADNPILLVAGDWPKGVLGPPASRLVEKYGRPAIVFSIGDDGYTGSARSIAGVHMLELIEKVAKDVEKYGGHKAAAGLSVSKTKYEQFLKNMVNAAKEGIDKDLFKKRIKIDAEINPLDLSKNLISKIGEMEPFGLGNPRPVFKLSQVELTGIRLVGSSSKHLSGYVAKDGSRIKTICFNFDRIGLPLSSKTKYDIVFNAKLDSWNDRDQVCLQIIDARKDDQKD